MNIDTIIISFVFYSICGWLYESVVCPVCTGKNFTDRGFLIGPYCPVYGIGSVACVLCFKSIDNPFILMFASMLLCGIIEYTTAYLLEKTFHARWWDYSGYPFQIHGRVCLYGLLIFGTANVVTHYFIQPVLLSVLAVFPYNVLSAAALLMSAVMLLDLIMTVASRMELNDNLTSLHGEILSIISNTMDGVSDIFRKHVPVRILNGQQELDAGTKVPVKEYPQDMELYDILKWAKQIGK